MFGSFSSWKVFHQNVDLDWGRWTNISIYLFSVFCFFTVHFFVLLCYIFHIFLFLTWNAKLEALTFPLSGTGGISLLGSQECAPEQKKACNPILLIYYWIAILQETIQKWANSLVDLKSSQLIIWKSGSSLIFLQLWSPQIDHGHKLGQIWKITSTNWTKSRQYKASLIETF